MARQRRAFDDEFKQRAVQMVEEGRTQTSVAKELGIAAELLGRWRKERATAQQVGIRSIQALQAELRAMERRALRAETERDILKKAVSIFSHLPEKK